MKLKKIYESIFGEDVTDAKYGSDALVSSIEKALNIRVIDFLGHGSMSDTFTTSDGKVLKITRDNQDADGLYFSQRNQELPVLNVFELYRIKEDDIPKNIRAGLEKSYDGWFYVAISEKLDTSSVTYDDAEDLDNWFEDNGFHPSDLHIGNIGKRDDGTVVYLDPQFRNIPKGHDLIKILKIR